MTFTSLDAICRSTLLKKRYSLHFYLDCLLAARDCLRELTIDNLRIVNTALLPVNEFNAVQIPSGAADVVSVEVMNGQGRRKLVHTDKINTLKTFDSNFSQERYSAASVNENGAITGFFGTLNTSNFNLLGEAIGGIFGLGDTQSDTYTIIPERNEIQLCEGLYVEQVLVTTIGDGQTADAASHVETYAIKAIEEYILWQLKEHRRDISQQEKLIMERRYLNEVEKLRARKNPLTISVLKKIVQSNTRQSIK